MEVPYCMARFFQEFPDCYSPGIFYAIQLWTFSNVKMNLQFLHIFDYFHICLFSMI